MINYAHRGASEYAPENTLAAFYLGLEQGANGIETDIRLTADGIPVLFHDAHTLRITGEEQYIEKNTYAQLYQMDMGSYKGARYRNEKIVTLEDFLRYFSGKDIQIALEIKAAGLEEMVLSLIGQYGCREKVTITSFEMDYLLTIRNLDKDIHLGFLTKEERADILDYLLEKKINQYCPAIGLVTKEIVKRAHEKGMTVRTWSIKNLDLMHQAIEYGVDGMTVNFPDELVKALSRNG